jgi:integral membrane protein
VISTAVGRLRAIGFLEGCSFLILLLIAMPIKYIGKNPEPVNVIGMLHGGLFILYVIALLGAWAKERWPFRTAFFGGLASVVPLGPFIFDRWLAKTHPESV